MTANKALVLAAIGGSGTAGTSLCYVGETSAAAPASTSAALTGFNDAGWIHSDGLTAKASESSQTIPAFGTFQPIRTIVTESSQTFDITFLETNSISLAVYNRLALTDAGLIPGVTGNMTVKQGPARTQLNSYVFDLVDGLNAVRFYVPSGEVTSRGDRAYKGGEVIAYPVTLTAYPDATGNSVYEFYTLDALVP